MRLTTAQINVRIESIERRMQALGDDHPEFPVLEEEIDMLLDAKRRAPKTRKKKMSQFDREWQHEQAMEAGMLHGIQGYNDIMGY